LDDPPRGPKHLHAGLEGLRFVHVVEAPEDGELRTLARLLAVGDPLDLIRLDQDRLQLHAREQLGADPRAQLRLWHEQRQVTVRIELEPERDGIHIPAPKLRAVLAELDLEHPDIEHLALGGLDREHEIHDVLLGALHQARELDPWIFDEHLDPLAQHDARGHARDADQDARIDRVRQIREALVRRAESFVLIHGPNKSKA
jgi:hypothetical protein